MRWVRQIGGGIGLAVLALAGCDRDSESALRGRLAPWFFLGETRFFDSRPRCTAAVFAVTVDRPRDALVVQDNGDDTKAALRRDGHAAIRIEGFSPNDLTDDILLSGDGAFGKQVLAAAAQVKDCTKSNEIGQQLYDAFTRPGATLVYDSQTGGLIVLDSDRMRLIYAAGDTW